MLIVLFIKILRLHRIVFFANRRLSLLTSHLYCTYHLHHMMNGIYYLLSNKQYQVTRDYIQHCREDVEIV